ncbi:hypothetical protein [Amycolatopsis methanolica]|uniref:Uncharacterized protein n=1 Tax=Amycolatopsis methanolica 239 TaxID=1068978 RepID=A0A076MHJ6_AMYME|nr:hypothetical protein [Amycolatopsis methanolica]AIJ20149.1 hypothetical protein AMETH_0057 [Amycolatopsis methanolica 239]
MACWLTVALVDAEDPVQRLFTLVHARRLSTVRTGFVAAAALCCVVLTAVSLAWAALVHHGLPAAVLNDGVVAHAACAAAGIGLGLPCSRLVLPRIGYTVLAALVLLGVVLLVRWVPVVNPMPRSLTGAGSHTSAVALGLLGGVLLLVVSAAVTGRIVHRRA